MSELIKDDILQEFKKITKLEISKSALKYIVCDYIERIYHVTVTDVEFLVSKEWEGYGPTEHQVVRFNGCEVKLKGE